MLALHRHQVALPAIALSAERRRLVMVAIITAILVHGVAIWMLWGKHLNQTLPQPHRIEVDLITPPPLPAPKPPISQPPPPRVQHVQPPPPKALPQPTPPARIEHSVERTPEPEKLVPAPVPTPPPPVTEPVRTPAPPAQPVAAPPRPPEPVSPPSFDAAYLNNPKPTYPPAARRMGLQGTVLLRVRVTAAGKPEHVEIITRSGAPILDQTAVSIVSERWTFVPARQGDRPIAGTVEVPIRFSLN